MRLSCSAHGLYVVFRLAADDRDALGFVVKPAKHMLFSERYTNKWKRSLKIGPLFFRSYARRAA